MLGWAWAGGVPASDSPCPVVPPLPKVMKRVRTEQIQMAVSCYLKRRQYVDSDGPLKQGLRLSQTAEEMAAHLTGRRGPPRGAGAGAGGRVPMGQSSWRRPRREQAVQRPGGSAEGVLASRPCSGATSKNLLV